MAKCVNEIGNALHAREWHWSVQLLLECLSPVSTDDLSRLIKYTFGRVDLAELTVVVCSAAS